MTDQISEDQEATSEQLSDAYREAVGSVNAARTLYDQARAEHGAESGPARRAGDFLTREIAQRNELREQYDQVIDRPRRP